ncbi:MAG: hypothetical protein IPL07_05490 [Acidimicrobiaceae bacterium]|nr:hypothetical protein [Acidimicrobiaceae bacterium]
MQHLHAATARCGRPGSARRCGFGAYFVPGFYEDHWVAEYWDPEERRWTMVDAQLDDTWRERSE